jgi:O-antigen/teichoic acid export membrane protein
MRLFRNTAWVLATSMAGLPLHFLASVVLARYLSVADRGLWGVCVTFIGLSTLLSEFGWGPATIYRLRRAGVAPRQVATASLWVGLAIGAAVVATALALEDFITARFMEGAPTRVFRLALAVVPVHLLWVIFASIARGLDRFALQNGFQLFLDAGRLAAMALVLIAWNGAIEEALYAYLVVQAIGGIGLVVAVLRETGLDAAPRSVEVREGFSFGIRAYAARLAGQVHERVDIFMIAWFLPAEQVAFYSVAVALISQLKVLPEAIGRSLYPQLAGTAEERTGQLSARVSRHSFAWVVATALAAAVAGPFLIPLVYGSSYAASVLPFLVLLPGMALFTRYRVLSSYFASIGHQRPNVLIQVLTTLVNIALNLYWIPRHGILGAALASLVSYATAAVLITASFMRHSGVGVGETLVLRAGDLDPYRRRYRPLLRRLKLMD